MTHQFVGTTCKALDLDPSEYAGMSVPQITADIMKTLAEISPGVNFWDADIEAAAIAIVEANRPSTVDEKFDDSDIEIGR